MSTIAIVTGSGAQAKTPDTPATDPKPSPVQVVPPPVPLSGVPLKTAIAPAPSVPTGSGPTSVPATGPAVTAPAIKPPTIVTAAALPTTVAPSKPSTGVPPTTPGGVSTSSKATAPVAAPTLATFQVTADKVPAFFVTNLQTKRLAAGLPPGTTPYTAATFSPWMLQVVGAYLAAAGGNAQARALIVNQLAATTSFNALPVYMQALFQVAGDALAKAAPVVPPIPSPAAVAMVAPTAPALRVTGLASIEAGFSTFWGWFTGKLKQV